MLCHSMVNHSKETKGAKECQACLLKTQLGWVACTFNASDGGGRGKWTSDFRASLVYKVCPRTAGATQTNPASNKQTKPNLKKKKSKKGEKENPLSQKRAYSGNHNINSFLKIPFYLLKTFPLCSFSTPVF